MAVPKKKTSRETTKRRRNQWAARVRRKLENKLVDAKRRKKVTPAKKKTPAKKVTTIKA